MDSSVPLKFAPFKSDIELPFYTNLFRSKLDHARLDDSAVPLIGIYQPLPVPADDSAKMHIFAGAMGGGASGGGGGGAGAGGGGAGGATGDAALPLDHTRAEGYIRNFNTIEAFRAVSHAAVIKAAGKRIWDAIWDGSVYECPSLLASFAIISYADLKRHSLTYWFAFPALQSNPMWRRVGAPARLTPSESTDLSDKISTWRYMQDERKRGFFLAKRVARGGATGDSEQEAGAVGKGRLTEAQEEGGGAGEHHSERGWQIGELAQFETGFFSGVPEDERYVGFVDPSTYEDSPAWPLRNLLILIRHRYRMRRVKVICYRDVHARRDAAQTIILNLETQTDQDPAAEKEADKPAGRETQKPADMPSVVGWERNMWGKLQYKRVDMADHMDPRRLADSATDLNLKLMKWRLAPDLDLDAIRNTKCLLLGAGTLGGYVARGLLAWGVRRITFVDYGRVSYSNPVRQPLFEFAHCADGGEPKAARAAKTLQSIFPAVISEGHAIEVPMLGHPILADGVEKTRANFDALRKLVNDHDAVFLLMDTRESRWLPTVMGKSAGKIVMNGALGFDSWVAMRHGAEPEDGETGPEMGSDGKAKTLGCYFCNDVVAPMDSMKDQTLDQQCTVTRPGCAAMASAALVEMFASLLQHPQGKSAPAPLTLSPPPSSSSSSSNPLGLVPHQLRGSLATFQTMILRGESYPSCSACSPVVLEAYRRDGWDFVRRALDEKDYVTELSGLAEVQRRAAAAAAEMDEMDEGEFGGEGEDEGEGEMI